MEQITRDDLTWALTTVGERRPTYQTYSDYYRGTHRQVFEIATEAHTRYFRELLERVRENLCKPVVRCFAERMAIREWKGDNARSAEALAKVLRLSAMSNRVHTEALKVGDAYILVWPDQPEADRRMFRQSALEMATRPDEDDPDRVALATKVWVKDKRVRVNLYYDDRLERYSARAVTGSIPKVTAFEQHSDAGGDWLIRHGFGEVPVVRFANDADNVTSAGTSINEDVIPLQDVLNKTLADMLIASEFFALPMRIFTGVTSEVDPRTGKTQAETFDPRRDRNLFFGGTDTKAFTLPSGDLRQVMEITDSIALKVARVSGVPMHYLVLGQGQFPSGEALRTAEARLVSKVTDLHDEWGPCWAKVMALLGIPEVEPIWLDPAHITGAENLERLQARKDLGEPWAETMKGLGYTEEDIPKLEAEKEAERASAGAAFSTAFDAGQ